MQQYLCWKFEIMGSKKFYEIEGLGTNFETSTNFLFTSALNKKCSNVSKKIVARVHEWFAKVLFTLIFGSTGGPPLMQKSPTSSVLAYVRESGEILC